MKTKKLLGVISIFFILCSIGYALFTVLKKGKTAETQSVEVIPTAPDYADSTMWFVTENDTTGTGADVFYIVSTWELDWLTADGKICHYADVQNEEHRTDMAKEISRIAEYMAQGNNFYAPYYRHITLDSWATRNEDTIHRRAQLAMSDVKQVATIHVR